MRWVPLPDMVTATNSPRQFFNEDGEVFVYALKREGGPDDSKIPRRIIGTGHTRASAYASAVRTVAAYDGDSSYQCLPSS